VRCIVGNLFALYEDRNIFSLWFCSFRWSSYIFIADTDILFRIRIIFSHPDGFSMKRMLDLLPAEAVKEINDWTQFRFWERPTIIYCFKAIRAVYNHELFFPVIFHTSLVFVLIYCWYVSVISDTDLFSHPHDFCRKLPEETMNEINDWTKFMFWERLSIVHCFKDIYATYNRKLFLLIIFQTSLVYMLIYCLYKSTISDTNYFSYTGGYSRVSAIK
jgi:hypothetical protein